MPKRFWLGYFYFHPPFSFNDEVIFLFSSFPFTSKDIASLFNANTYVSQRLIFFLISSLCLHNTTFIFCLFHEYTVFRQRTSIFRTTKQPEVFYNPFQFFEKKYNQLTTQEFRTSADEEDIEEVFSSLLYSPLLYLGIYLHWFSVDYELLIERSLNGHATIARRLSHDHSLIAL